MAEYYYSTPDPDVRGGPFITHEQAKRALEAVAATQGQCVKWADDTTLEYADAMPWTGPIFGIIHRIPLEALEAWQKDKQALAWRQQAEAAHVAGRVEALRQAIAQLVQCNWYEDGENVVITVPACVFAGLLELAALLPPKGGEDE